MSVIDDLKEKAREWGRKVVALSQTDVPPNLEGEKSKLLSRAKFIKTGIEKIFGTLDQVPTEGMGFLPVLIPVAVIGASAAGIAKWTYDFKIFMHKVNMTKQLVSEGLSTSQAISVVNDLENKSTFAGDLSSKVFLPITGILLFYKFLSK